MTPTQRARISRIVRAVLFVAWVVLAAVSLYRDPSVPKIGIAVTLPLIFLLFAVRARRETKEVFTFYVATNEILIDGEGNRYHFEIADVVRTGERIVKRMRDAPPLTRFSLGALYYSIGDHNGAVEQLGFAAEEEVLKESQYLSPSTELKRYVKKLRRIERRPKRYAKFNKALSSLERMRHERAGRLLAESQKHLRRLVEAYESQKPEQGRTHSDFVISSARSLKSITAPPTISEVLNEVYQEES